MLHGGGHLGDLPAGTEVRPWHAPGVPLAEAEVVPPPFWQALAHRFTLAGRRCPAAACAKVRGVTGPRSVQNTASRKVPVCFAVEVIRDALPSEARSCTSSLSCSRISDASVSSGPSLPSSRG